MEVIFSQNMTPFNLNFLLLISLTIVHLPTKFHGHRFHRSQEKYKLVEGDCGQYLEKYELELLEIWCVYPSYLDAFMLQILCQMGVQFARYKQINFCTILKAMY